MMASDHRTEDFAVGVAHPEQLGDHRNGHHRGERIDRVNRLVGNDGVQDAGDCADESDSSEVGLPPSG